MVEVVGVGTALPTNRRFLAVTLGEGEGGLCGSVNAKKIVVAATVVRLVVGWGGRIDRGTGNVGVVDGSGNY